jgi:hypothetical protein
MLLSLVGLGQAVIRVLDLDITDRNLNNRNSSNADDFHDMAFLFYFSLPESTSWVCTCT